MLLDIRREDRIFCTEC